MQYIAAEFTIPNCMKLTLLLLGILVQTILLQAQKVALFYPNPAVKVHVKNKIDIAAFAQLNTTTNDSILAAKPQHLELLIPTATKLLTIKVKKVNLLSPNFSIIKANDLSENVTNKNIIYYQSDVADKNGFAAITICKDEIIGVVSDGNTNFTIGKINAPDEQQGKHIIYSDKDIDFNIFPSCQTDELHKAPTQELPNVTAARTGVGCTLDMYMEASYQMYLDKGSNATNVFNYVTGIFNIVQLIYKKEQIDIQIRELKVWNTADPENAMTTTTTVLNSFSARMGSTGFNGDLAHYVTTKNLGGGLAWVNVLNIIDYYQTGMSASLDNSLGAYPTYSWNGMVIAHEIGHNIGSNHTQWCGWPGGAIDNCYATEGGCALGATPTTGGTIMSYCHLTAFGINFNNGFGTLPGNLIRNKVATTAAICNCNDLFVTIEKSNVGCGGANNGAAKVFVEKGTGPFTYAWSNGATTQIVTGLAQGDYYVTVTSATAGCTVVKGVKIENTATTIYVDRTPIDTLLTECNGNTITMNAIPLGGTGTYTYQWYNGATLIGGAATATYNATTTGVYSVQVTSGTCTGVSSVLDLTYALPPAPVLTPNKPSPICANDTITLTVSPSAGYKITWYKNNVLISGASGATYKATTSGTYKATLTTLLNCTGTSSDFTVVVNPAPTSSIFQLGTLCGGQSATLNAITNFGTTYQWYLNGTLIPTAITNTHVTNSTGSYTVKITDANGCGATSGITYLSIPEKIPFTVVENGPLSFCPRDSVKLTAVPILDQGSTVGGTEIFNYQWYLNGATISGAITNSIQAKVAGNYGVKVGSNRRCDSTRHGYIVTIFPTPTPTMLSSLGNIIAFGATTTFSTPIVYATYQWYLSGALISGATSATYSTSVPGIYAVEVTDGNGCKGISSYFTLIVLDGANYVLQGLKKQDDLHALQWNNTGTTAVPVSIERSIDGVVFESLYIVTDLNQLKYNDQQLFTANTYYYRLKWRSTTGQWKYSNTIIIYRSQKNIQLVLYPNPVRQQYAITSNKLIQKLYVTNTLGQIIVRDNITAYQKYYDASNLSSGQYIIRVLINDQWHQLSMVKE
jgi:hypothetical protein